MPCVHAAPPQGGVRDPTPGQLIADGRARGESDVGGAVEPLEPAPDRGRENAQSVMPGVPGEVRVKRRHQWHRALHRIATPGEPQRTFGVHMDQLWPEPVQEPGDATGAGQ